MKKLFYFLLPALAACSQQVQADNKADISFPEPGQTIASENVTDSDKVRMTGSVHFSFEQSEFISQGKTYFIEKSYAVIGEIKAKRKYSGAYNITLHNICIQGKILNKEQNKGNNFGPLGRYEQAVIIEGLC